MIARKSKQKAAEKAALHGQAKLDLPLNIQV
jgi:hypothetical protein